MRKINLIFSGILAIMLMACSHTAPKTNTLTTTNANMKSQFQAITADHIKKSLPSDYHLMMSLLNRPITADQQMMLAFAQQREQQNKILASYRQHASSQPFIEQVTIRGSKHDDPNNSRVLNKFSHLIAQDPHAIKIAGTM